ncbi:MAG: DUF2085 domain-containing protein [Luteitalea sp.]|nr:DUF2085 domain-containing protein [Luteitalea sp.]
MWRRTAVALLLVTSIAWAAAIVAAPLLLTRGGDGETVPRLVPLMVYVVGSFVCHQRPERSFHVHGSPVPVCARCLGLYAAAPIGLAAALGGLGLGLARVSPRAGLLLAALPTVATLAVEWAAIAEPGNVARFAAALPLAAVGAYLIGRGLLAEC